MKRLILAAVAVAMLAAPAAQAAERHQPYWGKGQQHEQSQKNWNGAQGGKSYRVGPSHHWQKPYALKSNPHRPQVQNPFTKYHSQWNKGKHVPAWQRKQVVRDYHRHGLYRPGYGQHWVRVGNDYLLVSIASGLIAGLIVAR